MGTVGVQEMVVIFLVALVLFGPKKLPELGRTIGKAITEFRRASNELKASFEREMHNLERETEAQKVSSTPAIAAANHPETYSYNDYNGEYVPEYEQTATISSPVGASEVPGAESKGTAQIAAHEEPKAIEAAPATPVEVPGVEGTVPRTETPQRS